MATKIVTTDVPGNVKPSFASSSLVGLTVRANGEEATKVLDMNGNMVDAQFPSGIAPTLAAGSGTSLSSVNGKWAAYEYVYAATSRYPLVENDVSVGGSLAPRGQPSPAAAIQITGGGNSVIVTMHQPPVGRSDIDQYWIFRTAFFDTSQEALDNAAAGNLYFLGSRAATTGTGTQTYEDTNPLDGTDQIEVDNFGIPTFRYVIYSDPYWWGWGNFPLSVQGSWNNAGVITLTDATKWYPGRNGHYVRLEGVEIGGIGNNGLWLFKWIDATHAQLTYADGSTAIDTVAGTGTIVIQGPPTTLFRSKPRNPFSWGFTEILADGSRIPQIYAFKIGGGLGTAIAQVPTVPYLLLSTEYPAGAFTLDLRQAGSTGFEQTLRQISNFYSITSHFSQFTATRQFFPISGSQMRQEKIVLWGWDAKNYCIVETDGIGINVVSEKISKTLRRMSRDRSRQILAHGAYDAHNRMNCMWLPTQESFSQVDMLIMHHAPTDQWFIHDEKDLLCSAQFQDGDTNLSKIYGGTETGLMGEIFADDFFSNWVSSGRSLGTITDATDNTITRDDGIDFFLDRDGYIGNWCLITDANGENEQWARISMVEARTLTFDVIRQASGAYDTVFDPPIAPNSIFYVGMIECRLLKYFDLGVPAEDKKLSEIWGTLDGVGITRIAGHNGSTFLRYYRDRKATPFAPKIDGRVTIPIKRVKMDDSEGTQVWFTSEPPTERIKTFGVEIVDRGFERWRIFNFTLKAN